MLETVAKEDICLYNQTGFCKYKGSCQKAHDNELCTNSSNCPDKNCTKRHPKSCRNIQTMGNCRFKEGCAYTHVQQSNEDNLLLVQTLATHFKEVIELKEELSEMKLIVEKMQIQINTLCKIVQDDGEIKQTKKDKINESTEVEDDLPLKKHQCDVCGYLCEKEITLKKHKNTKHVNVNHKEKDEDGQVTTQTKCTQLYCDQCEFSCKTKKNLKKHNAQLHVSINKNQKNVCNSCGKKFIHIGELDIHFKEEHPNCKCTADSVCDECIKEWLPKPQETN